MQPTLLAPGNGSGDRRGAPAYRYFDLIMAAFVAVLLISNTVVVKVMRLGPFHLGPVTLGPWITDGATFLFPVTYIFGDILTEVYGYARSRRVIWAGFGALALASLVYTLVGWMPAADDWTGQEAYRAILGQVPRFAFAGLVAFWVGEFCNSVVLARLKVATGGRHLWLRTIGSTVAGQAVDTTIFVLIGFWGVLPPSGLRDLILFGTAFKVAYETLATPLTYAIVTSLKRAEHEDYYDVGTDFNPFRLAVSERRRGTRADAPAD